MNYEIKKIINSSPWVFDFSLSLSLAFTSFIIAIISSGHELSLLRAVVKRCYSITWVSLSELRYADCMHQMLVVRPSLLSPTVGNSQLHTTPASACSTSLTHSPQAASVRR